MKTRSSVQPVLESDARWVVYKTIADTTWRMFVPVIGLTLAGYVIDKTINTLPAGVFTGMGIGIVLAIALVVHQYRQATKHD